MNKFEKALLKFKPIGFGKSIDWSKVMKLYLFENDLQYITFKRGLGSVLNMLKWVFVKNYDFEVNLKDNSQVLCFYGMHNYSDSHRSAFSNLVESLDNVSYICAKSIPHKQTVFNGIKLSLLELVWGTQLIICGCSIRQALRLSFSLAVCFMTKRDMERVIRNSQYKLFITYYDAVPDENLIVQMAINEKMQTATLQHGIFCRKVPCKEITDTAIEFYGSISDYYFAWNKYTKEQWEKCGLDAKRIKVLGIPRYCNFHESIGESQAERGVFGIMLNGSTFHDHNMALIKMGNHIAEELGLKYVVRYHPSLKSDEYVLYLNEDFYLGESDNCCSIAEYGKTVDFTIISSSSVMIDLVYLNCKVFRLVVSDTDTYSEVTRNAFSTVEELKILLQDTQINEDLFDYLCTTRNVTQSYESFIKSLI